MGELLGQNYIYGRDKSVIAKIDQSDQLIEIVNSVTIND